MQLHVSQCHNIVLLHATDVTLFHAQHICSRFTLTKTRQNKIQNLFWEWNKIWNSILWMTQDSKPTLGMNIFGQFLICILLRECFAACLPLCSIHKDMILDLDCLYWKGRVIKKVHIQQLKIQVNAVKERRSQGKTKYLLIICLGWSVLQINWVENAMIIGMIRWKYKSTLKRNETNCDKG